MLSLGSGSISNLRSGEGQITKVFRQKLGIFSRNNHLVARISTEAFKSHQILSPPWPNPYEVPIISKTQLVPRGLGLTLKLFNFFFILVHYFLPQRNHKKSRLSKSKSSYFRVKLKRINLSCKLKLNQTSTRPDLDLTCTELDHKSPSMSCLRSPPKFLLESRSRSPPSPPPILQIPLKHPLEDPLKYPSNSPSCPP